MIVTIYSSSRDCPWSGQLKAMLRYYNTEYEEYFPYSELAEEMAERYNYPSFPHVWCDAVFIGIWKECRHWLLGGYR